MVARGSEGVGSGQSSKGVATAGVVAAFLSKYAWLITSLLSLALAYLAVWQRGFWCDDFSEKAVNLQLGDLLGVDALLQPRSFSALVKAELILLMPSSELTVRVVCMLFVGLNAFLLGWLLYRLLGSRLAALVGGWLLLAPFLAFEAVLWISAVGYIFSLCMALLFVHCLLNTLTPGRRWQLWVVLGALAYTGILLFLEAGLTVVVPGCLLGLAYVLRGRQSPPYRTLVPRLLHLCGWSCALVLAIIAFALAGDHYWAMSSRGGADLDVGGVARHARIVIDASLDATVSGPVQLRTTALAGAGLSTLLATPQLALLAALAFLGLAATAITWRGQTSASRPRYRVGVLVLGTGVLWLVLGVLFPTALIKEQGIAYRLFYFPLAGLGVASAGLAWLVERALARLGVAKVLVAAAGVVLLFSVLCTVGYTRLFLARYELDRQQADAVMRALPSASLPANSTVVVFDPDVPVFGGPFAGRTDMGVLVPVFGSSWSAEAAFQLRYCRTDLRVLPGSSGPGVAFAPTGDGRLKVGSATAPLDTTVLVVYRQGHAAVVEQLINLRGNSHAWVIDFPLAHQLVQQGTPGVDHVVVLDGYWDNRTPPVLPDQLPSAGQTAAGNAVPPAGCEPPL